MATLLAPPIDALLLDFGHTLCDTASSVEFITTWTSARGLVLSASDAQLLWDDARVRSRSGEEVAKGRDRTPALHRACWTALWAPLDARAPGVADALYDYETGPLGWTPYVDTLPFLRAVRERGVRVAVVSDVAFELEPIAEAHGFADLVDTFVLSYRHGALKADGPALFEVALAALDVPAPRSLMVGDNNVNDGVGISAGLRTLLLPHAPSGGPRGLATVLAMIDGLRRVQTS